MNHKLSEKRIFSIDEFSAWTFIQTVEEFRENAKYVRAYHGCRSIDLNEYIKDGLRLPSKEGLTELTYRLLGDFIKKETLDKYICDFWENHYVAKGIYFVLDKSFLINQCGHYMIYGSEFVCSIAGQFGRQSELKKRGKPTIIHVDIPVEMISDGIIQELVDGIQENFEDDLEVNFGFRVTEYIPSERFVYIEHPKRILDPLNNFFPYRNKEI